MKKILTLIAVLLMQVSAWAVTEEQPAAGNGTSSSPYQIATTDNLVWFANQVNKEHNTSICAILTDDISLGDDQTMIGTYSDYRYAGTFDGDGHTITVNYTATAKNCALFSQVNGATIKNLIVKGSISTGYTFAGGIVGYATGVTVSNCICNVAINISFSSETDASIGGVIGHCTTASLSSVMFNGKLLGQNAKNCGGMIGWSSGDVSVKDCLFTPSQMTISTNGSCTIARGNNVNISNCYYVSSFSFDTEQGNSASKSALASGEVCYKLNNRKTDGSQNWYQNVNNGQKDATPLPFKDHGTIYGGQEACPSSSKYSNTTHIATFDGDGIGQCESCNSNVYQPATNKSSFYLIRNAGNFGWFACNINNGYWGSSYVRAKLTADIDLSKLKFSGNCIINTFYGHLTGDNSNGTNYALKNSSKPIFNYLSSAYVDNLIIDNVKVEGQRSVFSNSSHHTTFSHVTIKNSTLTYDGIWNIGFGLLLGSGEGDKIEYCITESDCEITANLPYVGGMIGSARYNSTISYCQNKAKVWAPYFYTVGLNGVDLQEGADAGGIIGRADNCTIKSCLNWGSIFGTEVTGGIIGWASETPVTKCVNLGLVDDTQGKRHYSKGGIVGLMYGRGSVVSYCLNFGTVNYAKVSSSSLAVENSGQIVGTLNSSAKCGDYLYYYCQFNGKHTESQKIYDQMLSGFAASQWNDADGNKWLYQTIDNYNNFGTRLPVPIPDAGEVFSNILCDDTQSYSNRYQNTEKHTAIDYDSNGLCDICGNFTSQNSNIHVTNGVELNDIARYVNSGKDYSSLTISIDNDIDMNGLTYTPIGNFAHPYKGTFNGNGHRIKNLALKATNQEGNGLFGFVAVCSVKDLVIDKSCSVEQPYDKLGTAGLIGCVKTDVTNTQYVDIYNCGNEANVTSCGMNAAGILGDVYNNDRTVVHIYNCYNSGNIIGKSNGDCGSIVGYARKFTVINNTWNSGTISGNRDGYPFAGTWHNADNAITDCFDVNTSGSGIKSITSDDISCGVLCYKLNDNNISSYTFWNQNIGTDEHPVFAASNATDGNIYHTRTMSNHWGSICLPFDVEISHDNPYKFYQLSAVADSTLTLKELAGRLSAGTPALVYMDEASMNEETGKYELLLTANGNVSTKINTPAAVDGLTLTGTFSNLEDLTNIYYIYDDAFWYADDPISIAPFRAYLNGTISSGAKRMFIFCDDDETTGLEEVRTGNWNTEDGAVYNLTGQRLTAPCKGINIINGKKILIK